MLDGRQRVLNHVLDVQIRPYLMQVRAQIIQLRVGEHDELHARRGLVVVQLVLAGAVAEEGVVGAAELLHHVAQREDQAEDELLVVLVLGALGLGQGVAIGGYATGGLGARRLGRGRRRRCGGGPAAGVDALGWRGERDVLGAGCADRAGGVSGGLTVAVEDVEGVQHHGGAGAGAGAGAVRVRVLDGGGRRRRRASGGPRLGGRAGLCQGVARRVLWRGQPSGGADRR